MEHIKEEMTKPILIGGAIVGVINGLFFAIPMIGNLNCCCCLLYVLSGVITAHLMTGKYIPSDVDYTISGALSGGIAALISWLLGLLISIIMYGATTLPMGNHYPSNIYAAASSLTMMICGIVLIPLYMLIGAILGSIGAIIYRGLTNN